MSYEKGDLLTVTGTFKTLAGAVYDPTTVLFKQRNPSGTAVTLTYPVDSPVKRDSTGVYYVNVDLNASGTWYFKFQSTGTGQAASKDEIVVVEESVF